MKQVKKRTEDVVTTIAKSKWAEHVARQKNTG